MQDFRYVTKKQSRPIRQELIEIIEKVQNDVRKKFTFQYRFVGRPRRNMITYDAKSNKGFDFDVDFEVNNKWDDSAKNIHKIIYNIINKVAPKYGYDYCEESTSVLTIKKTNPAQSRILSSCDFAIVYNSSYGKKQYIRFNKIQNNYTWEYIGESFENLSKKIAWLKKQKYWTAFRDYYIKKKNFNNDPCKHSRSIFAETVNEMCSQKGYFINTLLSPYNYSRSLDDFYIQF